MPVLTHKEYNNQLSKEEIKEDSKELCNTIVSISGGEEDKVPPKPCFIYKLLHPENGVDSLQNFEDVINLEGKKYKRVCKNGIVETEEGVLAEFLLKKGYLLMEKKETEVLI